MTSIGLRSDVGASRLASPAVATGAVAAEAVRLLLMDGQLLEGVDLEVHTGEVRPSTESPAEIAGRVPATSAYDRPVLVEVPG